MDPGAIQDFNVGISTEIKPKPCSDKDSASSTANSFSSVTNYATDHYCWLCGCSTITDPKANCYFRQDTVNFSLLNQQDLKQYRTNSSLQLLHCRACWTFQMCYCCSPNTHTSCSVTRNIMLHKFTSFLLNWWESC